MHYESRLLKRDAPVVTVMRELASQYPRYGYRRIQVFLGASWASDERRTELTGYGANAACKCRESARGDGSRPGRPRPLPATGAGYLWAYDFVFDACANGQQLKCRP